MGNGKGFLGRCVSLLAVCGNNLGESMCCKFLGIGSSSVKERKLLDLSVGGCPPAVHGG